MFVGVTVGVEKKTQKNQERQLSVCISLNACISRFYSWYKIDKYDNAVSHICKTYL